MSEETMSKTNYGTEGAELRKDERRRAGPVEKEIIASIVKRLVVVSPQTLGDLYRANKAHPWVEFLKAVDYLVSDGLLEGKGDGFAVQFALTTRGRIDLSGHH